jgi:hypothetical protein
MILKKITSPLQTLDFTEIFVNLKSLNIIEFSSLVNLVIGFPVKRLAISNCISLKSISKIGSVVYLRIEGCGVFSSVEGLMKANKVELLFLRDLVDFSFVGKVTSNLLIDDCPKFDWQLYRPLLKTISQVSLHYH